MQKRNGGAGDAPSFLFSYQLLSQLFTQMAPCLVCAR